MSPDNSVIVSAGAAFLSFDVFSGATKVVDEFLSPKFFQCDVIVIYRLSRWLSHSAADSDLF